MSLKTSIWNLTGTPYYHVRVFDTNFQLKFSWDEKDTGQLAVSNESRKIAGIIPQDEKPLKKIGAYREIDLHENDGRPITEVDLEIFEKEFKKFKPSERYHLFWTREAPLPRNNKGEPDIGKVIKPRYITKDIPTKWLYETLKSNFIPQIMMTPAEKYAWLKDLLIVAFITVGFIGGMYMLYLIISKLQG